MAEYYLLNDKDADPKTCLIKKLFYLKRNRRSKKANRNRNKHQSVL